MDLDTEHQDAPKRPKAVKTIPGAAGSKAIEDIYQKKTQLEHILLRPDTYIGSTEKQQQPLWIHDGTKMKLKTISFAPGLYKIFDEILVNAADNKVRDPTMDTIKVTIDPESNTITVWNNGDGIPVEMHKDENVYVPELIFGHLLTSSNYNDDEKKVTGGRNGYGAKLANIFSTEFTVETCDGKRERRYKQTFKNNMGTKGQPKISTCKATDNWTSISFKPDLAKFGMEELEADTVQLMHKRVYDLAGVLGKGTKIFLNGERLPIKSFSDYIDLYLGPKEGGVPRVYERVNDRWEICISVTEGQFQQVSFVNSICTIKGGTHVNYVVDQITKAITEKVNKKNKHANAKPFMVRNHMFLFLNTNIENPAFDSQTKETLTLRASSFGSKCELPPLFLDRVGKCGLVDSLLKFAEYKNNNELKRSDGAKRSRLTGITKLDDANDAGGHNSSRCTLILTEGDSAKALAISGLGVVGRDHYGVFPLRGKLLNVRDAAATQISGNVEIQAIKQILGLQHGKAYDSVASLRYGHLMIMTDQDHDGSHIKGLIMNFLHAFFPSLLKIPGFLLEFITPIVKVRKGRQMQSFYTIPQYENWKESHTGGIPRGWEIKYYKGLGTSTKEEAREYFSALEAHRKEFVWEGDEDSEAIEMAFSKKKIEERKAWLTAFVPGTFLDHSATHITYTEFINKELILFSRADLERSIPSMVDGLKPGQRKILYSAFKRNLKKDIKVAQLAAYVSEHSAYHHGETSLATTIVNLAQDFVGSNNINLLQPSGQFGTRLQGGKDAASARYIYTRLAPMTRNLFHESDDALLDYLNEEGQSIEPTWYIPLLPMVLVNGAEGIGTGWSTTIPNYNPADIVANLKRLMVHEEQVPMHPWYRGFKGKIEEADTTKTGTRSYRCSGIIAQVSDMKVEITELPVRKWTQDYKEYLEVLVKPEAKDETPSVVDYREHHSDANVHFEIHMAPGKMAEAVAVAGGLEARFKLVTKFATSNMMLFNKHGDITHYQSPEHIVDEFYGLRLEYYERRRLNMLKDAEAEQVRLDNKARFIAAVVSETLRVSGRKRAVIENDMEAQGFTRLSDKPANATRGGANPEAADGADEEDGSSAKASSSGSGGYTYLLSMPMHSLTQEKILALQAEAALQGAKVETLRATDAKSMWTTDLDNFMEAYNTWEASEELRTVEATRQQIAARKGSAKGAKGGKGGASKAKPRKKSAGSDDEDEDMEDASEEEDDESYEAHRKKPAVVRKPPAPKAPAAAAPKLAAPTAAAAAVAAAVAPLPKKAPAAAKQPKASVTAAAPAATVPAGRAAAAKQPPAAKPRKKSASSDEEEDEESEEPSASEESEASDSEEDDERDQMPLHKLASKKPAAAAPSKPPVAAASKKAAAPAVSKPSKVDAPIAAAAKASKAAAKPAVSASDSEASQPAAEPQEIGFAARLAARFKQLDVTATTSGEGSQQASQVPSTSAAAAPSARSRSVIEIEQDTHDLMDDVSSPAPKATKPRAAAAAKVAAASTKDTSSLFAAAEGKQPSKRKPRKVVSDSESDEGSEDGSEERDIYEMSAPSPAVAPKVKKSKNGPSPLHMKTMSKTAAAAAPAAPARKAAAAKAPSAPKAAAAVAAAPAATAVAAVAADPPRRAGRAPSAKVVYVDISDDDDDEEVEEKEDESDYEVMDGSD